MKSIFTMSPSRIQKDSFTAKKLEPLNILEIPTLRKFITLSDASVIVKSSDLFDLRFY